MLKRIFDIAFALASLLLLAIPCLLLMLAIRLTSTGPAIYWSDRVGQHNRNFKMPKFRTMSKNTPALATHLLSDPSNYLTPLGRFLRRTSLDELPQFWSILKGDMSIVGPRPALFNQDDLIALRTASGVDVLQPGLTGWAQINGRDEIPIDKKVELDAEYLINQSFRFDLKIIGLTIARVLRRQDVAH